MLDRFLLKLAPGMAAGRAEARLRHAMTEKRMSLLQRYDASETGGRHSGWRRPATSAAAEIQGGLLGLRNASRDLVRNNPHANRAMRVLRSHIAGQGMRPRPVWPESYSAQERKALSLVARDEWRRFVDGCDVEGRHSFYGQERLGIGTVVESGEYLRVWFMVREDSGSWVWRCRVLEGDWLDHQKNEVRPDGTRIVQGVEFDAIGRRVAYHLHKSDPGDRFARGLGARHDVVRVASEFVDHVYEVLRPGQVRGVSWFAPVAVTLRDLDDLAEAELVRKKLEACIAAVVKNETGSDMPAAALSGAKDDTGKLITTSDGKALERMTPGMVLQAKEGWSLDYMTPTSSDGLVEHMKERLHAVAAGVGTTYAQLTGDLSGASFSSMREGRLEFNKLLDLWQDDLLVVPSGRPAWQRVMKLAVGKGLLPAVPRAAYTPPKRPWVDPLKDIKAAREEVDAGWASDQDMIERTGRDPEEVIEERRLWAEMTAGDDEDNSGGSENE